MSGTDTVQTQALVVLATQYRDDLVKQINRRSALMRVLRIIKGEGPNCAFVAEGDGMVAEGFAEGAEQENYGSDAQASAVLNWGRARSAFHITGTAMAAAASSLNPTGNLDLWLNNMKSATGKLASLINGKLFAGTTSDTTGIFGLNHAIGSVTNEYAGINRTTSGNAYFRPYLVTPGTATKPTLALIRTDLGAIYDQCGLTPDLAFCSTAVYNAIGGLFDATRREVREITTARGLIQLNGGFTGIEFDGCVFLKDKDCTANAIHYVNTEHVYLKYLPPKMPTMSQSISMAFDDGYGMIPAGITFESLAHTGDSYKAAGKSYLQLVVDRPNSCGTRTNIDTAASV